MKIQFFSHACFSVESDETILLNDPYLNGTAFNDGWDLIVDDIVFKKFSDKKLFIYYSHEHPDHFSIPFLKSIEFEKRKEITVLFQKTRDGRVKSYLKKEGFIIKELDNKKKVEISQNFYITIGQVPFYDSWGLIELDNLKILNANDCILENPDRIQEIKNITGKVNILFTQFSYANWVEGGADNSNSRAHLASEKLKRIKMQSDSLKPDFIVPFASMIRFCHVENAYMNDEINTPTKTVEFIKKNTSAKPFLMKPYEIWDGVSDKDNKNAVVFWEQAYIKAFKRPFIKQKKSYDIEKIKIVSREIIKRVEKRNSKILIKLLEWSGWLPSQIIKITDLNYKVQFSWNKGLEEIYDDTSSEFIEMTSESLYFLLKFDFGIDTLNVNARFKGSLAQKKSLIKTFSVLALNNTGRYITLLGLFAILLEPVFVKQGLRTVGIIR